MIKLNCDLGEGFGAWTMPHDKDIMPYVDMANVACGFHAGDPLVIQEAISLAKTHGVSIGAHPSYPDRQGFGRRHMAMAEHELIPLLQYQIAALDGMARVQGTQVDYVKPHGALYNDMMANIPLFETVMKAISGYSQALPVMIQSTPENTNFKSIAAKYGINLIFEAFADRRYTDDGKLQSRRVSGAVLSLQQMLEQVEMLIKHNQVVTDTGERLNVHIDSLCVHGDSVDALAAVKLIRQLILQP